MRVRRLIAGLIVALAIAGAMTATTEAFFIDCEGAAAWGWWPLC